MMHIDYLNQLQYLAKLVHWTFNNRSTAKYYLSGHVLGCLYLVLLFLFIFGVL